MLILLAAACLAWIGILSLAFMAFLGTGVSAGWIFAGALLLALAVWVVVMFREFKQAIRMRESFSPDDEDLFPNGRTTSTHPRFGITGLLAPNTFSRGGEMTCQWRNSSRVGKLRFRRTQRPGRSRIR